MQDEDILKQATEKAQTAPIHVKPGSAGVNANIINPFNTEWRHQEKQAILHAPTLFIGTALTTRTGPRVWGKRCQVFSLGFGGSITRVTGSILSSSVEDYIRVKDSVPNLL